MKNEWKLVGGPTTEWRGVNPDGTKIMVKTANYWLFRNGTCYVGPFISEKLCRRAAAQQLLRERPLINTLREALRVLKPHLVER